MERDIERVFLSEQRIRERIGQAAAFLDEKFAGGNPLAVGVLKGSVMFLCDLVRAMKTPVQIEFITVSSYGERAQSSGAPKIVSELSASVAGRDVLLVEDIVDSGCTLKFLKEYFSGRGARSFTSVTLLNKPARRQVGIEADYSCFEAEDEFLVGYGLDYAQRYRNLPYIGVLNREVYER